MEYSSTHYGIHQYSVWNTPVLSMEYSSTQHGILQYSAWNTPVLSKEYSSTQHEYSSTQHGIHQYSAWNTPVLSMEYSSTQHEYSSTQYEYSGRHSHTSSFLIVTFATKALAIICYRMSAFVPRLNMVGLHLISLKPKRSLALLS